LKTLKINNDLYVAGTIPNYEKANGEGATGFGGWFKSKNTAA
jgi:hypothetical protein